MDFPRICENVSGSVFDALGSLGYLVPLQLHCLLFIVGHIDEFPTSSLSLLPRSIRIQLLLLLPAVDVCKLEGTPVTNDISTNEIWKTLYRERMPFKSSRYRSCTCYSPQILLELKGIHCTWKDAYFSTLLSFYQFGVPFSFMYFHDGLCNCRYDHYLTGLIYSTYTFIDYSSLLNDESLDNHKLYPVYIHGIRVYPNTCHRLTPNRYLYMMKFSNFSQLIDILMEDCSFYPKYLVLPWDKLSDYLLLSKTSLGTNKLKKFFHYVEAISVSSDATNETEEEKSNMSEVLEIVFSQKQCSIKSVSVTGVNDEIFSRFSNVCCNLKQLEVDCKIYFPLLLSHMLIHHQELENFSFDSEYILESNTSVRLGEILNQLTTIKTLTIKSNVSVEILVNVLYQFFTCTYPITLTLKVSCVDTFPLNQVPVIQDSEVNVDQALTKHKSIKLGECLLFPSNFVSLFPRVIILKELSVDRSVLCYFTNLDSIQVDKFVFNHGDCPSIDSSNINDVCTVFDKVNARQIELNLCFGDEDTVLHTLASNVLSKFTSGNLTRVNLVHSFEDSDFLEALFQTIPSDKEPYFELNLNSEYFELEDVTFAAYIYEAWKKSAGGTKLKKIEIEYCVDSIFPLDDLLYDMAVEVVGYVSLDDPFCLKRR